MDNDTQRAERSRFRALVTAEIEKFAKFKPDEVLPAQEIHAALLRIKSGINPEKPRL